MVMKSPDNLINQLAEKLGVPTEFLSQSLTLIQSLSYLGSENQPNFSEKLANVQKDSFSKGAVFAIACRDGYEGCKRLFESDPQLRQNESLSEIFRILQRINGSDMSEEVISQIQEY